MKFVCVLTTVPNLVSARKLAKALLQKKMAACVNLISALESHYVWKNKIQKTREVQLVIKTRAVFFKKIESFLKKNHPYEVPELIALPIKQGSVAYLDWVSQATQE